MNSFHKFVWIHFSLLRTTLVSGLYLGIESRRDAEGAGPRKDAAATAKLMVKLSVIQATSNRRGRFMASSFKDETYRRVKGKLVIRRAL